MKGQVALVHIEYCRSHSLNYAEDLAIKVVTDFHYSEIDRKDALNYLSVINGIDYVLENFLNSSDEALCKIILSNYKEVDDSRILDKMIELNKASDDKKLYLADLIHLNSKYGIDAYIALAKRDKAVPDYCDSDGGVIKNMTEAISSISDLSLLPQISLLTDVLFSVGFKDNEYFGLYQSLSKAIRNMAQLDYKLVSEFLLSKLDGVSANNEVVSFCNYLLKDIETTFCNNQDSPMSIREVKTYIK